MRPVVSDLNRATAARASSVDWLGMNPFPDSGTFTSRVLDAGDARAVWGTLDRDHDPRHGITFETRSGNTPTPTDGSWSDFQAAGRRRGDPEPERAVHPVRGDARRGAGDAEPRQRHIAYNIDNVAPSAAIDSVDVSGTSASVSFSSPDSDIAGFQCSLDGGAFAACTSPKAFTGLAAGAHTVVGAADRQGGQRRPDRVADVQHRQLAVRRRRRQHAGGGNSQRRTSTRPRRR